MVHTLVHQTPELVPQHRAVAVVQTPQVSGVVLQWVVPGAGHTQHHQQHCHGGAGHDAAEHLGGDGHVVSMFQDILM